MFSFLKLEIFVALIAGALVDLTNDVRIPFTVFGIVQVVGGILALISAILNRKKAKQKNVSDVIDDTEL